MSMLSRPETAAREIAGAGSGRARTRGLSKVWAYSRAKCIKTGHQSTAEPSRLGADPRGGSILGIPACSWVSGRQRRPRTPAAALPRWAGGRLHTGGGRSTILQYPRCITNRNWAVLDFNADAHSRSPRGRHLQWSKESACCNLRVGLDPDILCAENRGPRTMWQGSTTCCPVSRSGFSCSTSWVHRRVGYPAARRSSGKRRSPTDNAIAE
jgi:hypothetical protein